MLLKPKPPNIYGFSSELYGAIRRLALQKSLDDPDFKKIIHPNSTKARSSSVMVMDAHGMCLYIIERNQNQLPFGTPGGKREPGEHPIDTAAREFQEETGCYVHGSVLDIHLSQTKKDLIIFVLVSDWKDLVPCPPEKHRSSTVYMTLLSLETALEATRFGEELYFTLDDENLLVYRDPKKVRKLEKQRGKKLTIVQERLFMSNDLDPIRTNGIRIRQAHRNDLNDSRVLEIFENSLKRPHPNIDSGDSEVSTE